MSRRSILLGSPPGCCSRCSSRRRRARGHKKQPADAVFKNGVVYTVDAGVDHGTGRGRP